MHSLTSLARFGFAPLAVLAGTLGLVHCDLPSSDGKLNLFGDGGLSVDDFADVRYEMSLERFDTGNGTFETLPPPPTARNLFWVGEALGKVIVVGGYDRNLNYVANVDVFDPTTRAWTSGASWPNARRANFVSIDGLVCAIGGTKGTDLAPKRDVECYDAARDEWATRTPIAEEVGEVHPVAYDGKVYLLGGAILGTQDVVTPHTKAFVFEPKLDRWTALAPLPARRGLANVVAAAGKLHVVGGVQESQKGRGGPASREMLVLDPATSAWTKAPQMPTSRIIGFGVDPIGTKGEIATYFGLGGRPTLDRFDPATNTWRAGVEPSEELDPGIYTSLLYEGNIYLLVVVDKIGKGGTESSGKLWKYDASKDEWSVVGRRAKEERDALFYGVAIGQSLYFTGALTIVSAKKSSTP